jgi:hypothetical protein
MKKVKRLGVREGYDLWSETYDTTPNPLVSLDRRVTLAVLDPKHGCRWFTPICMRNGPS